MIIHSETRRHALCTGIGKVVRSQRATCWGGGRTLAEFCAAITRAFDATVVASAGFGVRSQPLLTTTRSQLLYAGGSVDY
jgi:hypothetical protein